MRNRLLSFVAIIALLVAVAFGSFATLPRQDTTAQESVTARQIVATGARTATGVGSAFCGFGKYTKYATQLVVTAASGTTPTLDVTWQHSIDGGTTWYTVTTFTQRTAAGQELKVEAEVEAATAEVYGDCMRAIWTIGGTTPSFTFIVDVQAS